jgi:hypothetical protein
MCFGSLCVEGVFASFDNAPKPLSISLPHQRLASLVVWHSECLSGNREGENQKVAVHALFASVKEKE